MPVNAGEHESVDDTVSLPGLQWPVVRAFFLSGSALQAPRLWQSWRLMVQNLGLAAVATAQTVPLSGTAPLWSWTSIRHSGAGAPLASGTRPRNAVAHASTATRSSRGRFTAHLDIEFPPSGSQLSRSPRLAVDLAPGQYCPGGAQRALLYRELRAASEDRAGGQRGGSVVSPVVSGNTSTQT